MRTCSIFAEESLWESLTWWRKALKTEIPEELKKSLNNKTEIWSWIYAGFLVSVCWTCILQ
jgi:hypothetical protein